MHNVVHRVDGDILTITINIGADSCRAAPRSHTGRTNLVATTSGYMVPTKSPLGFDVAFSLNVTVVPKPHTLSKFEKRANAAPIETLDGQDTVRRREPKVRTMVDRSERDRRKVAKLYRNSADRLLP
jgi:hypothetical protein